MIYANSNNNRHMQTLAYGFRDVSLHLEIEQPLVTGLLEAN